MPAQVDGAGCDVDVHEVVNYSALYVVLDPVDQVPPSHIDDLYERKIPEHTNKPKKGKFMDSRWIRFISTATKRHLPVQFLIQWLIGVFITFYPLHKVSDGFFCVTVRVVWTAQLHLLKTKTTILAPKQSKSGEIKICSAFLRLTTMFSAITSGSSHTDSTKNT